MGNKTQLDDEQLRKILSEHDYVTNEELGAAAADAKKTRTTLVDVLLRQQLISKDLLGQAVAEFYGVPYADLNSNQPSQEQVRKIPEETGKTFRVVLFAEDEKSVTVTTDEPKKEGLKESLTNVFEKKKIAIAYSLTEDIDEELVHYQKTLATRFSEIIKGQTHVAPEIISAIFEDAITFRASDIHIRPQKDEIIIRFRIDGVMQEAGRIKMEFYENILNRIKVMAHLRIDEHNAAQDGAIRYKNATTNRAVDLRVSIVPTIKGEKVALRVLAQYVQAFSLSDIGLEPKDQKMLEEAAQKPFGMILVTGPTGSGKTTTLYAVLKKLNSPDKQLMTIEDPVEYQLSGINQIQVNPATDLTFAKGLRSIVRQDPDIILVGEIRDEETAEIAVNAALTGHLLLSTFHANDAATTIPRLLDMGSEPFLLASTLELIIAQRLVRKICEHCRASVSYATSTVKKRFPTAVPYLPEGNLTLYKGKGCKACNDTGFDGRTAIFELIRVDNKMEALMLKTPSAQQVWQLARKSGARSLFEDGIEKVKNGLTTLEELYRVAQPPEEFDETTR